MFRLFGKQKTNAIPDNSEGFFGKTGNGTLDLHLSKTDDLLDSRPRSLAVSIGEGDFDAIYQSALESKGLTPLDTSGDYDWEKYAANRRSFISAFPQYPMIVSFTDMYQDYILRPTEIASLLSECHGLQRLEMSEAADLALRKILFGCYAAQISEHYLAFICD